MDIDQKRAALGTAIRQRRESQGLSQYKLALMIGSSKSHIWRIETGRVGVGLDDLARIAEALDVEVRELVSF
ncbi:MAG: helix-turn-helix transcriptional regulator [Eggerthellaceae bacterium]|jgi:transcriptional regulator with XRE-family HTH domain|nr:helix-turn-helix transcriptional regulator [Eggerthellaceae bacterium]